MAIPQIWLDDLDTYLRAAVGRDSVGTLIDISGADSVYFDVLLPTGNWVQWNGTPYTDNNSIQYNMVAADYFKGSYLIQTVVIFTTGVRKFRGNKYIFEIKERGE